MKVYIVLPTYNEAENIATLVQRIFSLYPDIYIIVVDDNSPDGTGEIADTLTKKYPNLSVIHRPKKGGLGKAYVCGFKKALSFGAQLIFEMDADFSHDPGYIKDLVEAAEKADVVIGSRYIKGIRVVGWPFRRLLLSKLANIYVSYIMVKPVRDSTSGFRCYRREVLKRIHLENIWSDGYAFQIEMTYLAFKHGFRVIEVPITFMEREHGVSKISRKVVLEAFWITLRCHAPIFKIIKHLFKFRYYRDIFNEYYISLDK